MTRGQLAKKYNVDRTPLYYALENFEPVVKFCEENQTLCNHYEEMDALKAIYAYFKHMREEARKAYEVFDREENRIMTCMEELNEYEYEQAFGN